MTASNNQTQETKIAGVLSDKDIFARFSDRPDIKRVTIFDDNTMEVRHHVDDLYYVELIPMTGYPQSADQIRKQKEREQEQVKELKKAVTKPTNGYLVAHRQKMLTGFETRGIQNEWENTIYEDLLERLK